MVRVAARLACFACLSVALVAAPQVPPTFRAGVDIVTIDVVVLDKRGQPVKDLAAGNFDVALDGKKAKVRVADFRDLTKPPAPAFTGAPASAAENRVEPPVRSILVAIDDLSFPGAEAQPLISDLTSWITKLGPDDRVGVMT